MVGYDEGIGVEGREPGRAEAVSRRLLRGRHRRRRSAARSPMTVRMTITTPADFTANGVGERISRGGQGRPADRPCGGPTTRSWRSTSWRAATRSKQGDRDGDLLRSAPRLQRGRDERGARRGAEVLRRVVRARSRGRSSSSASSPRSASYAQGFPTNISFLGADRLPDQERTEDQPRVHGHRPRNGPPVVGQHAPAGQGARAATS